MLKVDCPWCGVRNEDEFVNGGESHVERPMPPEKVDEDQWAQYLFYSNNPKGPFAELWFHKYGCRQWFNMTRNTATHEILNVYKVGESNPMASLVKSKENS